MHPLSQPWAITEEGFQLVLAVWSRGDLFAGRLAAARAAYGDRPVEKERHGLEVKDGVGIIHVQGPLFRKADWFTAVSGATSYATISKQLDAALADEDVRQILLLVDSPGGEAAGCGELADRIRAAHGRKPVTAYIEGTGASAAYWLASAAGEIVAAPTALVGSIGVRIALIDDEIAQEKMGVREIEIVSSQSPGKRATPIDDKVQARIQVHADDLADVFISAVAAFRGVTVAKVQADFGQGDVVVGAKAVVAGLVSRLGSFDSLFVDLRTRAKGSGYGAFMSKVEVELVPKDDLAELQKKLEAQAPLVAQVASLTGKNTIPEMQAELAKIGIKAARADELQTQLGDERTQLLTQARAKGIPPVAMRGWEHLSLEALREVVAKTEGIKANQPAVNGNGSEPVDADATALTDEDRRQFAMCGITDEAKMLEAKRSMARRKK